MHLAAALGVPLVAIFAGSKPGLTGPVGSGPLAVLGAHGAPPSVDEVSEAVERLSPCETRMKRSLIGAIEAYAAPARSRSCT